MKVFQKISGKISYAIVMLLASISRFPRIFATAWDIFDGVSKAFPISPYPKKPGEGGWKSGYL